MPYISTIGYFAGPGNICQTYRDWLTDPYGVSESSYSGQFFSLIGNRYKGVVISSNASKDEVLKDDIYLANAPYLNKYSGIRHIIFNIQYKLQVAKIFKHRNVRIAIVQSDYDIWTCIVFKLFGIRIINSVHCMIDRTSSIHQILNYFFLRFFSDGVMCVSVRIKKYISQNLNLKLLTVVDFLPTLSIDPSKKRSFPTGVIFTYLYVGRVERNKGVVFLLDAFAEVKKDHPNSQLVICGDGGMLKELKNITSDLGLTESVLFLGHVNINELDAIYENSNVVVVPTSNDFPEGFNKIALEAAMQMRPVIITSVCPVVDEIEGFTVINPDNTEELISAMVNLRNSALIYENIATSHSSVNCFIKSKPQWREVADNFLQKILIDSKK